MNSVLDQRGQGALSPFCLTKAAILPILTGMLSGRSYPGAVESPLARRALSVFFCSTGAEGALRTWSGVREDERGPAGPADDFENGAPVGGNKGSAGEGFRPVDLVGKGDGVVSPVDSSLIQKRVERPPLLRGNAESSLNRDLGCWCWPSLTSNRPSLHGREVGQGDTFPETNDAKARYSRCCAVRGWGERRLSRLLSCPG